MSRRQVRITHRPSGTVIAEGPLGWTVTPFEGNYYVRRKCLRGGIFRRNWVPGLCPSKFLYVWLDVVPGTHPELEVSVWESAGAVPDGDEVD